MCSNVIIFRLHTKQLLAPHTPLLSYTSLPFTLELLHSFKEPFIRSAAIPLPDNHLCSFLDSVEPPYVIEHNTAGRSFLSTLCRKPTMCIQQFVFFPRKPHGPSLPMTIDFHFVTLVHALQPLDLVMTQQFFTNIHDHSHLVVE